MLYATLCGDTDIPTWGFGLVWFFSMLCAVFLGETPTATYFNSMLFKACSRSASFGDYCLVALSSRFPESSASVMFNFGVYVQDWLQSVESLDPSLTLGPVLMDVLQFV